MNRYFISEIVIKLTSFLKLVKKKKTNNFKLLTHSVDFDE
jgi:hypothetical protein